MLGEIEIIVHLMYHAWTIKVNDKIIKRRNSSGGEFSWHL